jgi:hypothetical protein
MHKEITSKIRTSRQRDDLVNFLKGMTFEKDVKSWDGYLETILDNNLRDEIRSKDKELASIKVDYAIIYQLEKLRDYYNDGWEPDWSDGKDKFTISFYDGKIQGSYNTYSSRFLAFPTREIRVKFLENHVKLIEYVKYFL